MTEDSALGRRIMAVLSNQLACAYQHVVLLGRLTAYERVATFMLDLARRRRQSTHDDRTVELPMTRRDLADYFGLTVETVSRVMSGLKRKGVIFFTDPKTWSSSEATRWNAWPWRRENKTSEDGRLLLGRAPSYLSENITGDWVLTSSIGSTLNGEISNEIARCLGRSSAPAKMLTLRPTPSVSRTS